MHEIVEQLRQANARFCRAANNRNQRPFGDRPHDEGGKLLGCRLFALEILHHQLFIDLDDRLDEGRVNLRRIDERAAAGAGRLERAHNAFEVGAVTDGHVEQHALVAKRLANAVDQRRKFDVVLVHLVDDDDPANACLFRFPEHTPRVHLDATMGIDDDHRGIDGPQTLRSSVR